MNTLKKVVFVFALVAISSGAFAQAQFSLGLKGGLNFANLDVSNLEGTYNNRTGYHLGAFALFKFTKIGIQPEIIFSEQGSKVKDPNLGSVESNFSYVNVPIILKLYTVAGINLQVGPQFGFLTSAEFDDNNIKDQLKNSDTSLALGAGWDLPFGLSIDARYNLGLKNVSDDSAYDIKNQVWQVSVGYKLIKIGK
ncbi:MAG: PorT family protein [Cyclobacteriaceae bacterium]|nr:PorT family protein [Cyclobacteriaceae bacterium]